MFDTIGLKDSKRENNSVILLFDQYHSGLNACDRLNRVFHGMS